MKNRRRTSDVRGHEVETMLTWYVYPTIVLSILLLLFFIGRACADIPTDEEAVHCILGEARGEGYASMLGHAEALRNRGTIKRVYGCNASFEKEMPYLISHGILLQAKKAWLESRYTKTVKGAQYWGSLIYDKKWIAKMRAQGYKQTAIINNTVFFRKD